MRAALVLPIYNESGNLGPLLDAVDAVRSAAHLPLRVVAVDDGSTDDSLRQLSELKVRYSYLDVVAHCKNKGMAAALRTGFQSALDEGAEVVVCMDADLTHDPADLPALLGAVEDGADLVIGSRYIRGGRMESVPAIRAAISQVGNTVGRLLMAVPVLDMTSGYRAYRREVLEAIDLREPGFGIQLEAAVLAQQAGFRLAEVPIVLRVRAHGYSKMVYNRAFWQSYLQLFVRLSLGGRRTPSGGKSPEVRKSPPLRG
jgi:glycosyltransferase involved in cell wall biosynthesis